MANEAIERAVDDMIAKDRISRDLRDEYINHFETNLSSDLLRGSDYTTKLKNWPDRGPRLSRSSKRSTRSYSRTANVWNSGNTKCREN